jgi:hypothetical protein
MSSLSKYSKSGALFKKGGGTRFGGRRNWKKRLFRLEFTTEGPQLTYHSLRPSADEFGKELGRIPISAGSQFRLLPKSMQVTPDKMLQFCLWHESDRKYEIRAVTLIELREWQVCMEAAIRVANKRAAEVQSPLGARLQLKQRGGVATSGTAKLFSKISGSSGGSGSGSSGGSGESGESGSGGSALRALSVEDIDPDATPAELLSSDDEIVSDPTPLALGSSNKRPSRAPSPLGFGHQRRTSVSLEDKYIETAPITGRGITPMSNTRRLVRGASCCSLEPGLHLSDFVDEGQQGD